MSNKLSKKATTEIIEFVRAINPKASKLTTFDEAWEIIAEHGDLMGDLKTKPFKCGSGTTFILYKEDGGEIENIKEFKWKNEEVYDKGDWDWSRIYKDVCEYIIKNKVVKKPRAKKSNKTKPNNVSDDCNVDIETLKKKKFNMYQNIRYAKSKGKNVEEMIKEYNIICKHIEKLS